MANKDLWFDIQTQPTFQSPKNILAEQAEFLERRTNGRLRAAVRTSSTADKTIVLRFVIVVPGLDNYQYTLIEVNHAVEAYPATITLYPDEQQLHANNETEFEQHLQFCLTSDSTRRIVASLLSQTN